MAVRKLPFVTVLVALWSLSPDQVNAACDAYAGPSGTLDCFLDTVYYDGHQWGTCLTNAYIQAKSKGAFICRNKLATYCYYQCMVEVYGLDRGNITADCSCNPNATVVPPTGSTFPQDCYSPSGTDCDWYKNCLEKKYQCPRGSDTNVTAFAESFCRMYEQRSNLFSASGRKWVEAVRTCLQVQLTPLMRPFANNSCKKLKKSSYKSHFDCYKKPYINVQSVCNVTSTDFWQMFWIIRSSFTSSYSEALLGLLKVSKKCRDVKGTVDEMHQSMRKIVVQIKIKRKILRQRRPADPELVPTEGELQHWQKSLADTAGRSTRDLRDRYKREATDDNDDWEGESDEENAIHELSAELGDLLARQLGWKVSGVQWFAYGLHTNAEQIQVLLLLADGEAFNINGTSSSPNMTEVVQRAARAFQSGDIVVASLGGEPAELQTMNACSDIDCENVYLDVTAPSSAPSRCGMQALTGLVFAAVVRFMNF